ncbi:MAG: hypothetical protein B7Z75_06665 [Acidocella sp. 20-57-95]|nr:MAG: hypothetical protein B7Z75_06665 [Acidocella sp. 20-57-95]OYV60353.1 MAG: hypothetical protein B7Z71_06415 [Acidocella sp. 21-58-7]HQT64826.1 LysR family transcriptional regulator [Acidocella sp.]
MDLDSLKFFLRVAEMNSLTKAAPTLGISQPVISRAIAQLERELGGRLFNRTGHGVTLTALGEKLLPRTKHIVAELNLLTADAQIFANAPAGEVRVGMPPSFSNALVSTLLERARIELPAVKIKVFVGSTARLDEWVDEGRIDIALNFCNGRTMGDTRTITVAHTYLVGAAGSFLEGRPTVNFSELHNLPLILPATQSSLRKNIEELADQMGVTINPIMEVDTSSLYLKLAREGHGFAITTLHALSQGNAGTGLNAALITNPKISRNIMLGTTLRSVPTLASKLVMAMIADISKIALHT